MRVQVPGAVMKFDSTETLLRTLAGARGKSVPITFDGQNLEPRLVGEPARYETPSGKPVYYPNAYRKAFGRPIRIASTYRVVVGLGWLQKALPSGVVCPSRVPDLCRLLARSIGL